MATLRGAESAAAPSRPRAPAAAARGLGRPDACRVVGQDLGSTDVSESASKPLPPTAEQVAAAQDRFIETWGRMGSAWGISRTMAEVHALLYITAEPLCTDDVMARLNISRGNASMTLRALTDWGIAHRQHKRGDRKEYFQAELDIWTMFKTIARERKKRELDPLVQSLYDIRDMTGARAPGRADAGDDLAGHNERLDEMLDFIETLERLGSGVLEREGNGLRKALTLLAKVT